jgi:transcriptional regulator with XRE-family HTH domain
MSVTVSAFRPVTAAPKSSYSAQVTPLGKASGSFTRARIPPSRSRDTRTGGVPATAVRPYRHGVTETAPARKIAFASFVRRALDDARAMRAWTGTEVSRRTGVSRQTINRWVRGDWASDPEVERVVAFCEGLGLNPATAFAALGWDRAGAPRSAAPPPPMDPDVEALLRRLVDPAVSEAEKFHIRETIRYLAYRPTLPVDDRKRDERAG